MRPHPTAGILATRAQDIKMSASTVRVTEADFCEMGELIQTLPFDGNNRFRPEWNGGLQPDQIKRLMLNGDDAGAEKAEALMESLDIDVESMRFHPSPGPVGYSPRIGAYLAGDPRDMWYRERSEDAGGPIRLYVFLGASGGIRFETMEAKGIACTALAMALAKIRPVELYAVVAGRPDDRDDDVAIFVPVSIAPLDMSRVCAWLCRPAAFRNVGIDLGHKVIGHAKFEYSWPWTRTSESEIANWHAKQSGATAVTVPKLFLDQAQAVERDPKAWCETQLRLALSGDGEAHKAHKCHGEET